VANCYSGRDMKLGSPEREAGNGTILFSYSQVKVKLSLCLTKHHAMKTYWGSGGIAPAFLTSTLDGGQLHAPAALLPGIKPPVPIG
jgi:hypothetical protein